MDSITEKIKNLPTWLKIALVVGITIFVLIPLLIGSVAVVGTFVMGAEGGAAAHPPSVQFSHDHTPESSELTITHAGGEAVSNSNLIVTVNGNQRDWPASGEWESGKAVTVTNVSSGDRVELIWSHPTEDESTPLGSFTVN